MYIYIVHYAGTCILPSVCGVEMEATTLSASWLASDNSTDEEYPLQWVYRFLAPIVVIIGLCGNSLLVAVMIRKPFRNTSTSVYFIALAIADNINLFIVTSNMVLRFGFFIDLSSYSTWTCKLFNFASFVFPQLSSWILVNISIERFVAVYRPFKVKQLFTPKKAILGLCVITVLLLITNIQYILISEMLNENGNIVCTRKNIPLYWARFITWLDNLMYSIIPIVMLCLLNVLIVYHIRRVQVVRTDSNTLTKQNVSVVRTVLTLTTTFIVLTLPICLSSMVNQMTVAMQFEELDSNLLDAMHITFMIMSVNFCVNFFLYCLTGRKFRQELCIMLCCK